MACADATADAPAIGVVPVPQIVAPSEVEARDLLPSFLYLADTAEIGTLDVPWARKRDFAVGAFAQSRGAEVPSRLVGSAKSWLCHAGVDRTAAILPVGDDVPRRVSPLDATAAYLAHLRDAWNAAHAKDAPLEAQELYLTVPASFDAAARDLTVRAAREAGLGDAVLLEEPQAACYAWIAATGDGWRRQVHVGDVILVCDVGGGTTDFSLIAVGEEAGELILRRVAVGDHILLGGDNMDLALGYRMRETFAAKGAQLDAWQLRGLVHACRGAKESLLTTGGPARAPLTVLGRSRRVVGGALKAELTRDDAERFLVDGFFPLVGADARPERGRRAGLQEIGLPFAADARLTAHLAEFLARHRDAGAPTAVLFNGGIMKADALRERLLTVLRSWGHDVRELRGIHLDQAVARGAAYYGLARRGRGVRIRGGAARAYYIGVETAMPAVPGMPPPLKAVCVVPHGMEEGTEVDLPGQEFGLVVGEPVEFRMLGSSTRAGDQVGTVLERWDADELEELAPVETTVPWPEHEGTLVPVRLHVHLTEIGTLELSCVTRDGAQRWRLEFGVRAPDA